MSPNCPARLIKLLAIAVAFRDSDVRNVKALIIGPPETPYEFGFFEVRREQFGPPFGLLTFAALVQRQVPRRWSTQFQPVMSSLN